MTKNTRDKAKILNNLNDWIVRGPNVIHNLKTHQTLVQESEKTTKYQFFLEAEDCRKEQEAIEGAFDSTTFQEIRTTIFANFRKNLREGKNWPNSPGIEIYRKENFTSAEWKEIEKEIEKLNQKNSLIPEKSNLDSKNNFSNHRNLIIFTAVGLIIILIVGLWIIKWYRKKNGSKR